VSSHDGEQAASLGEMTKMQRRSRANCQEVDMTRIEGRIRLEEREGIVGGGMVAIEARDQLLPNHGVEG
jgi:hypothetical protein